MDAPAPALSAAPAPEISPAPATTNAPALQKFPRWMWIWIAVLVVTAIYLLWTRRSSPQ